MSTAFYPTNMRQMPSGGYNHNSTLQNIPYISWKGTGPFSNPVGSTSTHIRPLTNKDPGNIFPTGFGLARPIKHYRKGKSMQLPVEPTSQELLETSLVEYNINRAVKSSNGSSLGGGNGGSGLITQLIDTPGSVIIKENNLTHNTIDDNCKTCNGVGIVSDWYPINNLTEKPQPNVTNPPLCCNQQKKALKRVLPTSTNLNKNYFQTTSMYLYNRCQTMKQRQFNFLNGPVNQELLNLFKTYPGITAKVIEYSKPGDPLSLMNYYVAQCNPNFTIELAAETAFIGGLANQLLKDGLIDTNIYNLIINSTKLSLQEFINILSNYLSTEQFNYIVNYIYTVASNPYNNQISGPTNPKGCSQVYYKPNNPQFAKQGGVSSSTRLLKLNVDTITTAAALQKNNLYKDKVSKCNPATYIGNPFFFNGQKQNNKICSKMTGDEYKNFVSIYQQAASNNIGNIN